MKFSATFTWEMAKTVEFEAKDEAEADEMVADLGDNLNTDKDGSYVEDSFYFSHMEEQ